MSPAAFSRISIIVSLILVSAALHAGDPSSKAAGIAADILPPDLAKKLADRTAEPTQSGEITPAFVVDPSWPKTLPNQWIMGQVGGISVDQNDNIWVLHRPRSLSATAVGALGVAGVNSEGKPVDGLGNLRTVAGQNAVCCIPAPSVLKFDANGNLLDSWGGSSDPGFLESRCRADQGCVWPGREHGIFVDHSQFVYISGNGTQGTGRDGNGEVPWSATHGNDSHVLKFSAEGEFIYQIGYAGLPGPNNEDTNGGPNDTPQPFLAADMSVDPKTNRLYIADGYGNSRVLIVNAASGQYIGHFGAYGQNPVELEPKDPSSWAEEWRAGNTKPRFFRSPVHCATVSLDGLLYVCDRSNNRIQVFNLQEVGKPCLNPDAKAGDCGFVRDIEVAPETIGQTGGSAALSADKEQSCLFAADLWNGMFHIIERPTGKTIHHIGRTGRQVGEFTWLHSLAADSHGNIYSGEVETGQRVQRFVRYGATGCNSTGT